MPARLFQTGVRLPQTVRLGGTEEKLKLDWGCEGRGVVVRETLYVRGEHGSEEKDAYLARIYREGYVLCSM